MFAEVSIGIDTIAGGSVTGMLVAVMVILMRRSKDVDERRDEATRMLIDGIREQERRAWAERDEALKRVVRLEQALREANRKRSPPR